MTLFQRLFGRKESQARIVTTMAQLGQPQPTPANYAAFAQLGYGKSVIVYRCISMIAAAARQAEWVLYDKKKNGDKTEVDTHPFLELWSKPNPLISTADFAENLIAFFLLDGNSYVEANRGLLKGGVPLELWNVRPDKMKVVPGKNGYPGSYQFSNGSQTRSWEVDVVNMKSDICHWKAFHPINDWYGLSPLEAALLALDQNLAGQRWNLAMLQNSATPSGVLQVKVSDANPRGEITDEQYKRMRHDFEQNYQGVKNTGKPMMIEGGLTWTQMSFSSKDMDYQKGKEMTATDIALVYGVPPELLGLGQKTFNNYREARLSLYEDTIFPVMDSAMGAINRWLAPAFGDNLCLEYDKDCFEIIQWKREQKYISLKDSNFLTQNEKRAAVGYEEVEGWDVFLIGQKVGALPEDFAGPDPTALGPDGLPLDPNADIDPLTGKPKDPNADPNAKPKKPIKQPKPTGDDEEDDKGWKHFNLVNTNEKRSSWRRQNARRKSLINAFDRDLKADFAELLSELIKVEAKPDNAKLAEFKLLQIVDEFMPIMRRTLKRHMKYTLDTFGGSVLTEKAARAFETKANLKYDDYTKRYAERRSGQAITTISSTTQKNIRRIVGEWTQTAIADGDSVEDLSKYLESEFEDLTPAQANRIARTEVAMASNNGTLEAVKSLEIPNMTKEWVSAEDDRVRDGGETGIEANHVEVDGQVVDIDDKFSVPPDCTMDGPGDSSAPADQIINCRCVLTFKSRN